MSVPFNASGVAFCMLLGYSVLTHSLTHSLDYSRNCTILTNFKTL